MNGIVHAHGGVIRIQTAPNKGTTFRVFLPLAKETEKPFANAGATPDPRPDWKGEGTVLLVDDEPSVRGVMEKQLQHMGFDVVCAGTGREALRIFGNGSAGFRAVVLDMTMPEMNGTETLRELRRISRDLPVIVCSGFSEDANADLPPEERPNAFLQKPVMFAVLSETIRNVLENRTRP